MATKQIAWTDGSGNITLTYTGQGDGTITVSSDSNNLYEARSQQITVKTTDGSNIIRTVTIAQAAKLRIDISNAAVTASNQTYSGSAKTPTPTVTLNGSTLPSTVYNVSYSNNTNAGTATITVTGKGDYTGTATGTFTINKASRTLSFSPSYVVLDHSGTVTKAPTVSAGSGDGTITYSINSTTYATINASSGKVTAKTSDGSAIVTATISAGTNYVSASASYNLYVFATTHDYSYTGSASNLTLPPGTYKFQVWGAQGGSNEAEPSYGITSKAGGKGGYSVGQLSVNSATTVQVVVGGQGGPSSGGFNGGGSSAGYSSHDADNELGVSRMGGGGGATDIRLSSGSLYSRMIVAGGGSGGAMSYQQITTGTVIWTPLSQTGLSVSTKTNYRIVSSKYENVITPGKTYRLSAFVADANRYQDWYNIVWQLNGTTKSSNSHSVSSLSTTVTAPSGVNSLLIQARLKPGVAKEAISTTVEQSDTSSSITTDTESHVGFAGGGETGEALVDSYKGKQTEAGYQGEFGQGANRTNTTYRYNPGAGGGGWYGGGCNASNSSILACRWSGGGSGFVNTAASAGNRPSGYTGLQFDSGSTHAGNTSFESPSGGTETGHAGNGYARITRIS